MKINNKKIKQTTLFFILNSFKEKIEKTAFLSLILRNKILNIYFFNLLFNDVESRETINCVYKDMLGLVMMWRQIRGYPKTGATTHTNAKTARKNKLLFSFRLEQFKFLFGSRKRNIYPTLIKAEYNNRLWFNNWRGEWLQASKFVEKMAKNQSRHGGFNPVLLAGGQTNGYVRINKAAKIGKSKKLVKLFTVGVPVFFTRFIYYEKLPSSFSYRLILKEDVNKKLGKKLKRKDR